MSAKNITSLPYLFSYFFRAYPVWSILAITAMLFAGLAEGVGLVALLPLLSLVVDGDASGNSSALAVQINSAMQWAGIEPTITGALVLIVAMMILKALLIIVAMSFVGFTAAHVSASLRLDLLRELMLAQWSYFVSQRSGTLTTALSTEPSRASMAYIATCQMLAAIIQVAIYTLIAVSISWKVTLTALLAGGFIIYLLSGLLKITRRAASAQTDLQESLLSRLLDGLSGMKPLKAMAQEKHLTPLLEDDVKALRHADEQIVLSKEGLVNLPEPIRVLFAAIVLYSLLVIFQYPLEAIFLMILLFIRTVERMNRLQQYYQRVINNIPGFWFIHSVIQRTEAAKESLTGGQEPHLRNAITLRNVSFSYGETEVLKNISLKIPAGRFAAIVGPSGSGKTTIADLIISLLQAQSGKILIDNKDITDIDVEQWRSRIGYVPQETVLFHVSIKDNVTFSDPAISEAQVQDALERAGAWEFVRRLPEGMNTLAGERGGRLSGGQRQRIAIARALVREPELLVLDEATTALDPETEAGICKTLLGLLPEITILAISHQPAMQKVADIVYHLRSGHIYDTEYKNRPALDIESILP